MGFLISANLYGVFVSPNSSTEYGFVWYVMKEDIVPGGNVMNLPVNLVSEYTVFLRYPLLVKWCKEFLSHKLKNSVRNSSLFKDDGLSDMSLRTIYIWSRISFNRALLAVNSFKQHLRLASFISELPEITVLISEVTVALSEEGIFVLLSLHCSMEFLFRALYLSERSEYFRESFRYIFVNLQNSSSFLLSHFKRKAIFSFSRLTTRSMRKLFSFVVSSIPETISCLNSVNFIISLNVEDWYFWHLLSKFRYLWWHSSIGSGTVTTFWRKKNIFKGLSCDYK